MGEEGHSEVTSQYSEGLLGLTFNSKPIINNLTIIAKENGESSAVIARLIESRISQAEPDKKLPVIYLLDSIIKNVGGVYLQLFSKNIVNTYCNTFEKVDTNNRISMVHLLKTWIGVFPQEQVTAIQDRISVLVPANSAPQQANQPNAIHVNPKYLQRGPNDRIGPPTGGTGRGPPPPSAKGSAKGAAPPRPASAQGKGPPPAKGTMKAAPTTPPKNPAKPAAQSAKPAAPKPPAKTADAPPGTTAPSLKKVPAATAKGAKPAAPGTRPAPPKASPTKAIKTEEGASPGARPAGVPGVGRGAGGVPSAGGAPGAPGAGRGTGPTNGRVAAKPGELKDLKPAPSGRGRAEHHSRLGEDREHPYRRPPSKFGSNLINDTPGGAVPKPGDLQAQNAVNSLLQILGEQKTTPAAKPYTPSYTSYNPHSQTFNTFPFGQNQQQFPYQQQQYSQYNQDFQQFPFQQQFGGNNQFSNFNQQGAGVQSNAPFMQQQNQAQGFAGNQSNLGQQFPAQNSNFGGMGNMMGNMGGNIGGNVGGGVGMGGNNNNMGGGMGSGTMGGNNNMGGGMTGGMGNNGMGMGAPAGIGGMGGIKPVTSATGPSGALTDLKRQDRFVITKLYNEFALQCKICALRFNDSDRMAKHLDWHFNNNRKEKMRTKQAMSRPWYHNVEEWAETQGSESTEKASTPFFEAEAEEVAVEAPEPSVVADENQTMCPICHETFEQFWDSEAEEWMYRAAMINPSNGLIVHQKCYNPDAPMTSPPVSPRAASPMDTTTSITTTTTTTSMTTTTTTTESTLPPPTSYSSAPSLSPSSAPPDPAILATPSETAETVAPFSGVQGIDDLAYD